MIYIYMATLHVAQDLIDFFLPKGTIVVADRDISPASKWGGSWERINGYYLYAGAAFSKTNGTGKNAQGTAISIAQMPAHSHYGATGGGGGHSHEVYLNGDTNFPFVGYPGWNGGTTGNSVDMRTSRNGFRTYTGWTGDHTHSIPADGSGEKHSHNISTCECWAWRRIG